MAGGSFRRRRWFGCRLCPRGWLYLLILHESVPSPPQQSAGLHGHAHILQPPAPSPSPASPSRHQQSLFSPRLPRRPRVAFHRGPRDRIQANRPGGTEDESQRTRQHPLLANMTIIMPAPHYALTEPQHITVVTHTRSQMYICGFDSNISSKHLYKST